MTQKKYPLLFLVILCSFIKANAQVTWADNIACILYSNCTNCHNPNGAAPFSLITYAEASSQSLSIKNATQTKHMPPWSADRTYRHFAHERYLTDEEINLIAEWADNGAPQGIASHAPTAPTYNSTDVITSPDLRLQIPNYTVSGSGDVYRCFVLDPALTTDQFLTALEVIPGYKNIVHHVLFFHDTTGRPDILDAADPGPGYTNYGGTGSSASVLVGAWVPGQTPNFFPTGMGVKIPAGAKLVAQIHYPQGSAGFADSTRFNLIMNTTPVRNVTIAPEINHGPSMIDGPLFIPANTIRTFHCSYNLPLVPITVISVAPHMHLIGRKIKSWAITPTFDTIPLINIENWDFHWQTQYNFRQPITLPIGTKLYAEATYDNTNANPFQPSFPPIDVAKGEGTTDEMLLIYFGALRSAPGDENIVVDTSTIKETYANCEYSTSIQDELNENNRFDFYPNPCNDKITIDLNTEFESIEIYTVFGEKVASFNTKNRDRIQVDISKYASGQYYIQAKNNSFNNTKKLIIQ